MKCKQCGEFYESVLAHLHVCPLFERAELKRALDRASANQIDPRDAELAQLRQQLAEAEARCGGLERGLLEALNMRVLLCRHSDGYDEMGDPRNWDSYCKRWNALLSKGEAK